MTKNKTEKRAVRDRMAKTGERYTTARHYLLDLHHTEPTNGAIESSPEDEPGMPMSDPAADAEPELAVATAAAEPAAPPAWIEQPGMSDEAIQRNTGKSWDEWFALLDAWGATERTHGEIARFVNDTYDFGGWWAQGVTVGYERARGMRKRHELTDGFAINASKTMAAPVERLYAAFLDEPLRDQWLEPGTLRQRTSQLNRSARFDVVASGTLLTVTFSAKGEAKASVHLQELKLPVADDVEPRKVFWKARLNHLATLLTA